IYESLKDIALISKNCGGIGIDISDICANSDYIKGSSRYSSSGAIMVNLAIWHRDVEELLRICHELQTIFSLIDAKISLGYDLNGLYGQEFNNAYIRCE
ncbi:16849_t:CDS:2, partial [Racocetra persica]